MSSSIPSLFDLTGKTALVSGATGALGAAAAKALGGAGAHVVIAGGNADKLDALAGEFHGGAPRPRHLRLLLGGGRCAERFPVDFEVRVHRPGVVSRGFEFCRLLE